MRKFFAILIGKLIITITRITRRGGGSALPGLVALKIDPKLVSKITERLSNGPVIITGTNGKTTTAKYLSEILKASGLKVIANGSGSNMLHGIASTLIERSSLFGRPKGDIGLFEIDEATMPEATANINPKYILVTNLFRDQLDRYGELDKTATIIASSLKGLKGINVILNADDPLVASLSNQVDRASKVTYFGLDENRYLTSSKASFDSKDCILCGRELNFSKRYYAHLGEYSCSNCDFKRPYPDYIASGISLNGIKEARVNFSNQKNVISATLKLSGLYNIYNALGAYSLSETIGIADALTQGVLENVSAAFGRMEKIEFKGKEIYLLLIKNPIGFTQVIETLSTDGNAKNFLICLNDNFADGTDVSWIWDADLETLNNDFNSIICSGTRSHDMTLRLKYADLDTSKIETIEDSVTALSKALDKLGAKETLYILPTYTAMLEIRKYLTKEGAVAGFWEEQK
ncbi:hypothetical protein A2Y27_02980 [candidate division CPR2 bacterium GWD1_39_7]|nr:MAG: hypothetical protein UT59_C0013G0004 [candidate division CPR2 bacterium GW2011_GWD1_39_7]OGB61817.1 MAG: hypothetical protein A2Y27_02980 [candidate division CPR2 bacterium GWD1_39_7]